jgi:hypothetical protein
MFWWREGVERGDGKQRVDNHADLIFSACSAGCGSRRSSAYLILSLFSWRPDNRFCRGILTVMSMMTKARRVYSLFMRDCVCVCVWGASPVLKTQDHT